MSISPWIKAARIKTLVASIVPVLSAIAILPQSNTFYVYIFLLTIFAALIIQIVTNYINDLYDFLKGADKNRIGPKRMLQSGLISEKQIKKAIILLTTIGIIAGIPLAVKGGWPIVAIGLSSFLFAYLYTAGPFALAYNGLSDFFVFIYFGIIAVSGSYYLQTTTLEASCLYLGSSVGLKNVLLLIVNNLRDYNNDLISNKKTMVARYGLRFGKIYSFVVVCLSYISIFLLSIELQNHKIFYFMLFSIPLSVNILRDIFFAKPVKLNSTLGKVSALLVLDYLLLLISQLL